MRLYTLLGIAILMVTPTLEAQSPKEIRSRAEKALKQRADSVRRANAVQTPAPAAVTSADPMDVGMSDSAIRAMADPARQRIYSTTPLPSTNIFGDVKTGASSAPAIQTVPTPEPTYASAGATALADSRKPKPVVKKRIPTGMPISKGYLSPKDFGIACEANDMTKLNVNCDVYAQYLNKYLPDIEDRHDLAAWAGGLQEGWCVKGGAKSAKKVGMARGLRKKTGNVVMDLSSAWERFLKYHELCAFDRNENRIQFSTTCWNYLEDDIPSDHLASGLAVTGPPAPPPAAAPPPPAAPAPVWNPPTPAAQKVELNLPVIREKRGMSGTTKTLIAVGALGAGFAGYCWARESPCGDIFKPPTRKVTNSNSTIIHTFNLPNLKF